MNYPKLVGVIHLLPLAGAPGSHGESPVDSLQNAGAKAVQEALILAQAGFDGIIIENFGDAPFYGSKVPAETIASMAIIAAAVREAAPKVHLGINVLRNDGMSALAIAAVTGCEWIRVNVLSGVAATDQGIIEGEAAVLVRERERLHADVGILADVHVKHANTLSSVDIGLAIEEVAFRGLASAVVLSGSTTGRMIGLELLEYASKTARTLGVPIYIGSGATIETLAEVRPWVDGIIVGSALRKAGAGSELDRKKVVAFANAFLKSKKKPSSKKSNKGANKRAAKKTG